MSNIKEIEDLGAEPKEKPKGYFERVIKQIDERLLSIDDDIVRELAHVEEMREWTRDLQRERMYYERLMQIEEADEVAKELRQGLSLRRFW